MFHENEVIDIRTDSAQNTHNELDEDWCFEQSNIHAELQIIEMPDIVAFVFELDAVRGQCLGCLFDITKRIAKNVAVGLSHIFLFPVKLPIIIAIALCQWVKREIHRSHVHRAHLGTEGGRRFYTVLDRQRQRSTSRYVNHSIGRLFDAWQEPREIIRVHRRCACFVITCVKVQDGRASFRRLNCLAGNIVIGVGQRI